MPAVHNVQLYLYTILSGWKFGRLKHTQQYHSHNFNGDENGEKQTIDASGMAVESNEILRAFTFQRLVGFMSNLIPITYPNARTQTASNRQITS